MFANAFVAGAVSLLIVVASSGLANSQPAVGGPTLSPAGASVYFVDTKDGQTLPTKFTVHFGLKGMGVAPTGSDKENSGHHHLLIDTDLPPMDQPIPNDFNHLHFGAGQTEADITLTPGDHTLQLLLGDKNHIPTSPPLMSARIRVHVTDSAQTSSAQISTRAPEPTPAGPQIKRNASPPGAKVYFVYPTDGAYVTPSPVIRFGLNGMGVAPAGFEKANTGHHHLLIDTDLPPFGQPIPNDFNHLHFGSGQTEAKVTLPPGRHKLQLIFGDSDHVPHDPPIYSQPIEVTVTESGREPVVERKPRHRVREVRRAPRREYRAEPRAEPRAPRRAAPQQEPRSLFPFF